MSVEFKLTQEDADEFLLSVEDDDGCTWRIPMRTSGAVALYRAVVAGIGEYVGEMERARREFDAGIKPPDVRDDFEGVGDFNSDDPMERYRAHQAAKGRS